jgi:hypothetical protein
MSSGPLRNLHSLLVYTLALCALHACASNKREGGGEGTRPEDQDPDDEEPAGDGDGGDPESGLGAYCEDDDECDSGHCLDDELCSAPCETDVDCDWSPLGQRLECGTASDGTKQCVPPCGSSGYACVDGEPVSCATLDQTQCESCGCAAGSRCNPGKGCEPLVVVGEACNVDADCASENCGSSKICHVRIGATCTVRDCELCVFSPEGTTYCSRPCDADADCDGYRCVGYRTTDEYWCQPACSESFDGSCHGQCLALDGTFRCDAETGECTEDYYCECGDDCVRAYRAREVGDECDWDGDCSSALCATAAPRTFQDADPSLELPPGVCTMACTTDTECGAGLVCADIPCTTGDTACGPRCLPECQEDSFCAIGTCRARSTASGEAREVCDPKAPVGSSCTTGVECATQVCREQIACAPGTGQGPGAACTTSQECASGTCLGGKCGAQSAIGEHCEADAWCLEGACCNAIESASDYQTCQNFCES